LFLKFDSGQLQFISLASEGDIKEVAKFVSDHPELDLSSSDYDGRTALHLAAQEGHYDVVEYLIKKGANIHATDRWNASSLRCAMQYNRNAIAMLLRDYGAKLRVEGIAVTELEASKRKDGETSEEFNVRMEEIQIIFNRLAGLSGGEQQGVNEVPVESLISYLKERGLDHSTNKLIQNEITQLAHGEKTIKWPAFLNLMLVSDKASTIQLALYDRLIVPKWDSFCNKLGEIFEQVRSDVKEGHNADYIPELSAVDPELFAISVCTVDGQQFDYGDAGLDFSIQSCSKPILYSLALEKYGIDYVHQFVGMEPSGVAFNSFSLNAENKPHNACINSGAIVVTGIMYPGLSIAARFKQLSKEFSRYVGGDKVGFSQSVYLSEKDTANRNRALAYFMASKGVFPPAIDIEETIDFYLQMCSIEVNTRQLAKMAATYANYGNCPTTNERIMSFATVRRTMQLLFSCGMYDYSGRWATSSGLPAKSGVSGCIFIVVPGVLGLSIYSPRLAEHGNSVRGIEYAHRITEQFGWNFFDQAYNRQR
jgi:glutaminase